MLFTVSFKALHSQMCSCRLNKDAVEKFVSVMTNDGQFTSFLPLLKAIQEREEIESVKYGSCSGNTTSNNSVRSVAEHLSLTF
jgi:hypothetical protein